jgi:NUMOD3 motif
MMPHQGFKHSPETRARMTAAHTGKRHSPEIRAKISAGQRGKQLGKTISPARRAAVSAANRGKPKPLEQREKMSEAHIARRPPNLALREIQRLERRRLYKRALRERRRAGSYIRRYKEKI